MIKSKWIEIPVEKQKKTELYDFQVDPNRILFHIQRKIGKYIVIDITERFKLARKFHVEINGIHFSQHISLKCAKEAVTRQIKRYIHALAKVPETHGALYSDMIEDLKKEGILKND